MEMIAGIGAAACWVWILIVVSIAIGIVENARPISGLVIFFDLIFTVPGIAIGVACAVISQKAHRTCKTYQAI